MVDIANKYNLGGTVEIDLTTFDVNNASFIPSETRLSIKEPIGTLITVSGGNSDLLTTIDTTGSGNMQYYIYRPPYTGWYAYEVWAKDNSGREIVKYKGFEIEDVVF